MVPAKVVGKQVAAHLVAGRPVQAAHVLIRHDPNAKVRRLLVRIDEVVLAVHDHLRLVVDRLIVETDLLKARSLTVLAGVGWLDAARPKSIRLGVGAAVFNRQSRYLKMKTVLCRTSVLPV